jgi:hypothetical protein
MNKAIKTKYLEDLDEMLTALSFHRRRDHQEWKHRVDSANQLWTHINFGWTVGVNPSLGVKYLDLETGETPGNSIIYSPNPEKAK